MPSGDIPLDLVNKIPILATMKTFAIKTDKGYLANQGNQHWFEEKPVGWALFCTEDDAEGEASRLTGEYEIVEILGK